MNGLEPIIYNNIEQRSPEWFEIRKGVVTGSSMSSATGGPKAQQTLAYEKIAELYIDDTAVPPNFDFEDITLQEKISEGYPLNALDIMRRGVEMERYVMDLYTRKTGNKVQEVGFVKIDKQLGCSPDGLIPEGDSYIGAVEFKCPMGKKFIQYLSEQGIPQEYQGQALNYFLCLPSIQFVEFIIYHPGSSFGNMHVRRINREEFSELIDATNKKIDYFKKTMDTIESDLLSVYLPKKKIKGK